MTIKEYWQITSNTIQVQKVTEDNEQTKSRHHKPRSDGV